MTYIGVATRLCLNDANEISMGMQRRALQLLSRKVVSTSGPSRCV